MSLNLQKAQELNLKKGDQLYLRQFTGRYYIDIVKRPYTIVDITDKGILVQSAKLVFPVFHYNPERMSDYYKQYDGQRVAFYDTVAESIEPDPEGYLELLTWHPKREMFGTKGPDTNYPEYAVFGKYEHQPYLD